MKRCKTCGISKPSTAFTRQKQRSGNYSLMYQCKACACDRQAKKYEKETPEQKLRRKEVFIKRTYGIDMKEFNRLFEKQEGKCAGCGTHQSQLNKSLVIDHCHNTKKIRGLLCSGCNLALGNIKECPNRLISLANYIKAVA